MTHLYHVDELEGEVDLPLLLADGHAAHIERTLHRGRAREGQPADVRLESLRAEEHREEDAGVHEIDVQRRRAVLVVPRARLRVGEDLVGLGALLKLLGRRRVVGVLVGVQLERALVVRLLDRLCRHVRLDTE